MIDADLDAAISSFVSATAGFECVVAVVGFDLFAAVAVDFLAAALGFEFASAAFGLHLGATAAVAATAVDLFPAEAAGAFVLVATVDEGS